MRKILIAVVLVCSAGRVMASQGDSWNFRFSPFGLIIGMIVADLDYKVADHIVVGPSLLSWNLTVGDLKASASGFGVQGAYYLNPVFSDSFYFGGAFNTFSVSASSTSISGTKSSASASGTTLALKGGYHWFWESFNLNLGLVAGSSSVGKVKVKDSNGNVVDETSSPGTGTGLDFSVGFTF